MKIKWHGQSCFTIEHDGVTIVTDPVNPKYGVEMPKNMTADIVSVSHQHEDHNYTQAVSGEPKVLDWPGEYEIKEVVIQGIPSFHFSKEDGGDESLGENIIFVYRFHEFSICHLGDLGHSIPAKLLDKIGDIDILMIPVGGGNSLNAKKAEKVISQIEPRAVIPMHYAIEGLKEKPNAEPVTNFLKEMGASEIESIDSYTPSKSTLNTEKTEVILMNPTR